MASAEMGRAKWIEKMSNRLGIGGAYIMKKRISGSETVVEALNADVKNKNVIVYSEVYHENNRRYYEFYQRTRRSDG